MLMGNMLRVNIVFCHKNGKEHANVERNLPNKR